MNEPDRYQEADDEALIAEHEAHPERFERVSRNHCSPTTCSGAKRGFWPWIVNRLLFPVVTRKRIPHYK